MTALDYAAGLFTFAMAVIVVVGMLYAFVSESPFDIEDDWL